jgi:F-type H+-transporting ATPase subunit b
MNGVGLIPLEMPNPLLPAHWSEFIVGLVLAIVVAVVVQKVAVPRFEQLYEDRAAEIQGGINRAQQVQAEAEQTRRQYADQLASSRDDAAKLREQARAQAAQIVADARAQAQTETERMLEAGRTQLQVDRDQAYSDLRAEIGTLATQLAERIIGETLDDKQRTQRTVDRFLAELEEQPTRQVPSFVPEEWAGSEQ